MERLTYRDKDGMAMMKERGGWKSGGIDRLAAYEDFMDRWHLKSIEDAERIFRRVNDLGGTDLMAQYRELGSINHLRDLLQAEKSGQLVVLPCGTDAELLRDGHTFKADHWNHTLTAFRDAPENKSGKQVALFSIKESEAALAGKGGEG